MRRFVILTLLIGVVYSFQFAPVPTSAHEGQIYSAYYTNDGEWRVEKGSPKSNAVAHAIWDDSLPKKGWSVFQVTTDTGSFELQMRAAGVLEGFLMQQRIKWHKANMEKWYFEHYVHNVTAWPEDLVTLMEKNLKWQRDGVAAHADDAYWQHVGFVDAQFMGLVEGYNKAASTAGDPAMREIDLWIYEALGDILDLAAAEKPEMRRDFESMTAWEVIDNTLSRDHCTGFVRLLPDFSDFYFAQAAWFSYVAMNKIFKQYDFSSIDHPATKAHRFAFSSYPGILFSFDDYYVSDAHLAFLETTNEVANTTLYDKITYKSILTWTRVRVTAFMADTAPSWARTFAKYNSGTYNNQWLIADLDKFTPGKRPGKDFFWCLEQIPGYIHAEDITEHLIKQGYMPSFNIPYFKDVYDMSGYPLLKNKSGDMWDYEKCPRAKIFHRDVPQKVHDYESFKAEIRYNDFEHDPLSQGDSGNAPSSRYELKPPGQPRRECFGAMDAKTSTYEKLMHMTIDVIGSPTYDQQPIFEFSATELCQPTLHDGLPDRWGFPWQTFEWME